MKNLVGTIVWALIGLATTVFATQAQNKLTFNQVISGLATTSNTAQSIGIDTDAIRHEIQERIKAEGTENAQKPSPVLDVLKKLPQLIVQIQFDLDSDSLRPESWETIGKIADAFHHPLLAGKPIFDSRAYRCPRQTSVQP